MAKKLEKILCYRQKNLKNRIYAVTLRRTIWIFRGILQVITISTGGIVNILWNEFIKKAQSASIAVKDPFGIKYAESVEEVRACQKLRFRIFNQEQGKSTGKRSHELIDHDDFDDDAVHLLVYKDSPQYVIGTYRFIHTENKVEQMYSANEFHISGLQKLLPRTLEVGRSCVDPDYRDGSAVALLWSGIAETMRRTGMRYLIGCASLEDDRPAAAMALYEHFRRTGLLDEQVSAEPRKNYQLDQYDDDEVEALLNDSAALRSLLPPLLKGYMRLGAKICGKPAFDRDFGTLDFLILLDVACLPERYSRHFNIKVEA